MAESELRFNSVWKDVYFCKSEEDFFKCSKENVEKVQYCLEHDRDRLVGEFKSRNIQFWVRYKKHGVDIWFDNVKTNPVSDEGIDLKEIDTFFSTKQLEIFRLYRTKRVEKRLTRLVDKSGCPVYTKEDGLVFIDKDKKNLDDTLEKLDLRQVCELEDRDKMKLRFLYDDFKDYCKTKNTELVSVVLQEGPACCVAYFNNAQKHHTLKDLKSSFLGDVKKKDVLAPLYDWLHECFDGNGNPSEKFMFGIQEITNLGQRFCLRLKNDKILLYGKHQILDKVKVVENLFQELIVEPFETQAKMEDKLNRLKLTEGGAKWWVEGNRLFCTKESKPKLDEIKAKVVAGQISDSWKEKRFALSYLKEFEMEMINSLEAAFHVKIKLLEEEGKLCIEGIEAKALTDCIAQLKTFMGNLEKSEVFVPARVVDVLKEEILNVCKKHDCLVKSFCKTDSSDEDLDNMGTFVSWCDPQGMLQVSLSDKGPRELRCDAVIEFVDQHLFPLGSLRETLGNCSFLHSVGHNKLNCESNI